LSKRLPGRGSFGSRLQQAARLPRGTQAHVPRTPTHLVFPRDNIYQLLRECRVPEAEGHAHACQWAVRAAHCDESDALSPRLYSPELRRREDALPALKQLICMQEATPAALCMHCGHVPGRDAHKIVIRHLSAVFCCPVLGPAATRALARRRRGKHGQGASPGHSDGNRFKPPPQRRGRPRTSRHTARGATVRYSAMAEAQNGRSFRKTPPTHPADRTPTGCRLPLYRHRAR
jgi:hypothetical protein